MQSFMEIGPHVFPKSETQTHRRTRQLYIGTRSKTFAGCATDWQTQWRDWCIIALTDPCTRLRPRDGSATSCHQTIWPYPNPNHTNPTPNFNPNPNRAGYGEMSEGALSRGSVCYPLDKGLGIGIGPSVTCTSLPIMQEITRKLMAKNIP